MPTVSVPRPRARSKVVEYPPEGCTGRSSCKACCAARFVFRCARCRKLRPWCIGMDGAHPDWCDICWARHARRTNGKRAA